jgi:VIT1/CCC1 family predicted Fe2+/Mn2+ transporter
MPNEATATRTKAAEEEVIQLRDPLEDLGSLPAELRRLVHDQLQLAALELRLAGRSLAAMISAALFMGALLPLAWVALMASAGFGLVALGLPPAAAMLVLAVLTLALALLLWIYIRRRSADLGFPRTVRRLNPGAAKAREPELR